MNGVPLALLTAASVALLGGRAPAGSAAVPVWLRRGHERRETTLSLLPHETKRLLGRELPRETPMPEVLRELRAAGWSVRSRSLTPEQEGRWRAGALWHLRAVDEAPPERMLLEPRMPRLPLRGEDTTTARVSLAPGVGYAVLALGLAAEVGKTRALAIYRTTATVQGRRPSLLEVPDVDESREVWSLTPVPVRLVEVVPAWQGERLRRSIQRLRDTWIGWGARVPPAERARQVDALMRTLRMDRGGKTSWEW